jgi:YYY domain-containing protein
LTPISKQAHPFASLVNRRSRVFIALLLLLILAGAGVVRLAGNAWDSYQFLHPDERFNLMVASSLGWPSGVGAYLDESASPLNPRNRGHAFYAYGTMPVTVLRAVSAWRGPIDLEHLARAGRVQSALTDLATVWCVYLFAVAVYSDRRIGLFAAFLYGCSAFAIQQAHFFVVDPPLNLCLTSSLCCLAHYQRRGAWAHALGAGVCIGLGAACKITAVYLLPIVLLTIFVRARGSGSLFSASSRTALRFIPVFVLALLTFRLADPTAFASANPLSFVPSPRWLANLAESARLASGEADVPPGIQWAGRIPLAFPWTNMVVWGFGIAAGLTAWLGWGIAAYRLARRRRMVHLIPVSWVALLFFYQGTQWVTTMRYFLPLYGALCVLAAWLLVRWTQIARRRSSRRGPVLRSPGIAAASSIAVALASLLWAVAFTAIYRAPHSRIAASEWIYRNIPKGAAIGNEYWDDGLPVRLHGLDPFGNLYKGVDLRWYDDETPEKLEAALGWLANTEWIVLSSDRLYKSIPRLPARFPLATLYYQALFDGTLGFEKTREFTSFPRIGPVEFSSRNAEEAFTVYDHPVVMIFRKGPAYSTAKAELILGGIKWKDVVGAPARVAARSPTGLRMPDSNWNRQMNAAGWKTIFPQAALSRRAPAVCVLLFVYLLALGAAPLLFVTCPGLPDRGYGLSKTAGMLIAAWLAWIGSSTPWLAFERPWIWTVACALALAGTVVAARRVRSIRSFIHEHWRLVVASEVVFLAAFCLMAALRRSNPDLWHPFFSGEKAMDTAYLTAAVRASGFPLYNPWFAGSYINYYYFGFVGVAYILKAVAVPPDTGYNIAVALLYAVCASGVFSVACALAGATRRTASGWPRMLVATGAVAFALVVGNLKQIELYVSALARLSAGDRFPQLGLSAYWIAAIKGLAVSAQRDWDVGVGGWTWYFDATRALNYGPGEPVPITEFPFFTFSFGDLHAHLMSMPLFVLAIGLAIAIACRPAAGSSRRAFFPLLGMAALTLGALQATNTWDAPAAMLLIGAALVLRSRAEDGPMRAGTFAEAARHWLLAIALGWICFLPFHYWFVSPYRSFGLWMGTRTNLIPFLLVYGPFLLAIAPRVFGAARFGWKTLGFLSALFIAGFLAGHGVTAAIGIVLLAAAAGVHRMLREHALRIMPLVMACVALLLMLVPEWIVLSGDVGRMNTVFKLHFQAWVLLAICSAVMLGWVAADWKHWWRPWRTVWRFALVAALLGSLVYPLTARIFRRRDRIDASAGPSWDGLSFLPRATHRHCNTLFPLADDRGIIDWLRANVDGEAVIAEYNTHPVLYGWGSRISTLTGLPSVVGWDWHLRQQMGWFDNGRVGRRILALRSVYEDGEPEESWRLLRDYDVRYVVWGALENACAQSASPKFARGTDRFWNIVYASGSARIYRVRTEPAPHPERGPGGDGSHD